jgi:predicted ATPase
VVRELEVRGACLFLAGEAGIGKTTLVRTLRTRVGEKMPFLLGTCEPLSVPVPVAPLRELALAAGAGHPM